MAVRTITVVLQANVAGAIANVRAFQGALTQFGTGLNTMATQHQSRFNQMTATAAKFGAGLLLGFGLAERAAMAFDKQMSHVGAVADASAAQMQQLRAAALDAGKSTAFSATEAARGEEELLKAGVSTADVLAGALRGSLNLASAGTIELGKAATIASQAMHEFGLGGKDVEHIADVLTAGANKSAIDVEGLGYALGQAGGVAHQFGLGLEETTGQLAAFANNGMSGEQAGTALKTALIKLAAPTAKASELMQQYGINLYDSQGHFVTLSNLAGQLHDKLSGLSEEERNAALATLFGVRAIKAAAVLYKEGAAGVDEWTAAVDDQGIAAETARKKLDNLSGDLTKLKNNLQAMAIESSGGATAGLRFLAQGLTGLVKGFNDLPPVIGGTIVVLAGIGGATLLATAGFLRLRASVAAAMTALAQTGPVGAQVAGFLGTVGKWAGRALGVGAAAFVAYEGIKAFGDWVASKSAPVARDVDKMSESLGRFAETGKVTGELAVTFGADLGKLASDVAEAGKQFSAAAANYQQMEDIISAGGIGGGGGMNAGVNAAAQSQAIAQAKADLQSLDAALAKMAQNGGATQAKLAFDKLRESLIAAGVPADQINQIFTQYQAAAAGAAAANTGMAKGFADAGQQAKTLASGLQAAVDAGQKLTDVFNELNGANIGVAQSEIAVTRAVDGLSASLKENGHSFDVSTTKGAANTEAYIQGAKAAAELAQAVYEQTGDVHAAAAAYNAAIGKLDGVARSSGVAAGQVQGLHDQYASMPRFVDTQVRAFGLDDALWKIKSFAQEVHDLSGRIVSTTVIQNQVTNEIVRHITSTRVERWGGVHEARGGLVNAGIFAARTRPLYMFAEPETGGEAFIPRRGNTARSRSIADYVVSRWLGGSTDWGGSHGGGRSNAAGGSGMVDLNITIRNDDGLVLASLRKAVNARGGNVQAVVTGRSG